MVTLKNEYLTVDISEHGAEMTSLRTAEREYLWQADPEFWARHSPVLFPIVGNVYDKKFRVEGKEYSLGQHGFARDMDFEVLSQEEHQVTFGLTSSEETLAKFPFDFHLEITYRLHEKSVDVEWLVHNQGEQELHFQIGAHPAFYWPKHNADEVPRGFFAIESESKTLTSRQLSGKGCVSPTDTFEVKLDADNLIPLNVDTFDVIDTIILENGQTHRVALCDLNRKPILALRFPHPVVGLWSPPGKKAPFVCIEPWFGRCDSYGYEGEFKDREWVNHLAPSKTFETEYTIDIF